MGATERKHPDQERALSRRQQVLEAAACCFTRSGFHGASMAEISKAAGMSAGHIYNYFDSKDAIIAAFVQLKAERVSALMRDMAERADPLQAMLDEVEKNVRECLDPCGWCLPLEIFSEAARNPKIAALVQEADRPSRLMLRKLLHDARAERGLTTDEAMLDGRVEAVICLYHGLHLRALTNPEINPAGVIAAFRLALTPLLLG